MSETSSYQINRKKDKDKWFNENCRPISLLKIDAKVVSKVLAECLKSALGNLISSNQTVYLNQRFISEGRRLISGILEVIDNKYEEISINCRHRESL